MESARSEVLNMSWYNVHERTIEAPSEEVGALLDRLGSEGDPLWPRAWQPMRLDRPLQVGAEGGHGGVRYRVSEYEPGRRVRFTFHPATGIDGYHELVVEPFGEGRCVLRHVLEGEARGVMRVLVPLMVEALHDAVLEDLLDNAERAATGVVARPAQWSRWVRLARRATEFPKPRSRAIPERAHLARAAFDQVDFSDAWRLPRLRRTPDDPQVWASAIFPDLSHRVPALLKVRNLLVRFVGIEPGDSRAFETVAQDGDELLLGSDASHLDFRASILVDTYTVTVTTVVKIHNRRGRLYMAVVSRFHPFIVRRMLRRAHRRLDERSAVQPDVAPHGLGTAGAAAQGATG